MTDGASEAAGTGPGRGGRGGTLGRRRRAAGALVAALVATGAAAALAGGGPPSAPAHTAAPTMPMVFPDGVLDLATVSEPVAAEYRYAATHADAFDRLRCWCGCEAAYRHRSLTDCFVRPDGTWEAHGSGCGVCIAEAAIARQRLDAGVAVDDIGAELDSRFGPLPTSTD